MMETQNQNQMNEMPEPICTEDPSETEQVDDENNETRWHYYIVQKIESEFSTKNEVKKYLQENGIKDYKIIRGRILATNEKVKRIVSIS